MTRPVDNIYGIKIDFKIRLNAVRTRGHVRTPVTVSKRNININMALKAPMDAIVKLS
jgi:hypothetical protein